MPAIAFALPIQEGTESHQKELREALLGEHGDKMHGRRVEHGFRRIRVFRQSGAQPMVIVYLEADDLDAAIKNMAADNHEHNTWWADRVAAIAGRNPSDHSSRPQVELVLDWHQEKGHSGTHHD